MYVLNTCTGIESDSESAMSSSSASDVDEDEDDEDSDSSEWFEGEDVTGVDIDDARMGVRPPQEMWPVQVGSFGSKSDRMRSSPAGVHVFFHDEEEEEDVFDIFDRQCRRTPNSEKKKAKRKEKRKMMAMKTPTKSSASGVHDNGGGDDGYSGVGNDNDGDKDQREEEEEEEKRQRYGMARSAPVGVNRMMTMRGSPKNSHVGDKKKLKKVRKEALRKERLLRPMRAAPNDTRAGFDVREVNTALMNLVRGSGGDIYAFPPMPNSARRVIHLMACQYGIETSSTGSGKSRFTMARRTQYSAMPDGDAAESLRDLMQKYAAVEDAAQSRAGGRGGGGSDDDNDVYYGKTRGPSSKKKARMAMQREAAAREAERAGVDIVNGRRHHNQKKMKGSPRGGSWSRRQSPKMRGGYARMMHAPPGGGEDFDLLYSSPPNSGGNRGKKAKMPSRVASAPMIFVSAGDLHGANAKTENDDDSGVDKSDNMRRVASSSPQLVEPATPPVPNAGMTRGIGFRSDSGASTSTPPPATHMSGSASSPSLSPSVSKDYGQFEQFTKGFGSKMLKKMGFKGVGSGLGKHGEGVAEPVTAHLRKKKLGLGAD